MVTIVLPYVNARICRATAGAMVRYLDIDALLGHGVDLPTALAAGSVVYGRSFNPLITLKALSFFDDVPMLSGDVRKRLSAAVEAVDVTKLPALTACAQHGENGVKP